MDGKIMKKVAVGQLKTLRLRTSPVCRRTMNYSARARLFQAFAWKYPFVYPFFATSETHCAVDRNAAPRLFG